MARRLQRSLQRVAGSQMAQSVLKQDRLVALLSSRSYPKPHIHQILPNQHTYPQRDHHESLPFFTISPLFSTRRSKSDSKALSCSTRNAAYSFSASSFATLAETLPGLSSIS